MENLNQSPFGGPPLTPEAFTPEASPPASPFSLPVTPGEENSPLAAGTPDSGVTTDISRLIQVPDEEQNPPPTKMIRTVSISIENPTTERTAKIVASNLHLMKQEVKEDKAVDKQTAILRARDSVTSQIKDEGAGGSLQNRVRLMKTKTEMTSIQRRAATVGVRKVTNVSPHELPRLGESMNPVTRITEATFVPYAALTQGLQDVIHWDKREDEKSLKVAIDKMKAVIIEISATEQSYVEDCVEVLKRSLMELHNHRNDPSYFPPESEDDLGAAFRSKYMEIVLDFEISINVIQDPAKSLREMIKILKDDFEKGRVAERMSAGLEPLYKKEDLLSILRLHLSMISVISTNPEDLNTETIKSVQSLPDLQDVPLVGKLEAIQKNQLQAIKGLEDFISEVSHAPGSYVNKSVIDRYIDLKYKDHLAQETYDFSTGKMKVISLREQLSLQIQQKTTQYVSSLEALSGIADKPEDYKVGVGIISEVLSSVARYVPLTKLEDYFKLEIRQKIEDSVIVPSSVNRQKFLEELFKTIPSFYKKELFAASPHYYNKEDFLHELQKHNKNNVYDKIIEQIEGESSYFISKGKLEQILSRDILQNVLGNLKIYVLPDEILAKTEAKNLSVMRSAIQKIQAEQVFPKEFAFKTGLENKRELLMTSLAESLGPLRRFITPKFELMLEGTSLLGKKDPRGIASEWIHGKQVDWSAWCKYQELRKIVIQDQFLAELEGQLVKARQAFNGKEYARIQTQMDDLNRARNVITTATTAAYNKAKLEEARLKLCNPASQYSILSLGIIDMLFGAFDSHEGQLLIDSEGNYHNIDYARYGLPFFAYTNTNGNIFAILRSFSLDHPFAFEDLPPQLITDILQLNANSIEEEWRTKGLIADEEYFIRHNIFKEVKIMLEQLQTSPANFSNINKDTLQKEIAFLSSKLKMIKDAKNFSELESASEDTTLDQNMDFEAVKLEKIADFKRLIADKEAKIQLIDEAIDTYVKVHEKIVRADKRELKRLIKVKEAEKNPAEIAKYEQQIQATSKKIEEIEGVIEVFKEQDTLEDLADLNKDIMKKFLEDKSMREQELCYSKLSEPAFQLFKLNLNGFQNYLRDKGNKANLREGVETVYPFLKPFFTVVDRLEGSASENSSSYIETDSAGNRHTKYRTLDHIYHSAMASKDFFLEEELDAMRVAYEDLKNGRIDGFFVGTEDENRIAWEA